MTRAAGLSFLGWASLADYHGCREVVACMCLSARYVAVPPRWDRWSFVLSLSCRSRRRPFSEECFLFFPAALEVTQDRCRKLQALGSCKIRTGVGVYSWGWAFPKNFLGISGSCHEIVQWG